MSRTRFVPGALAAARLNLALDELEAIYTGTPVSSSPSGQFYEDRGAYVARYPDRLLVGAASDNKAYANRDALPRDWLSTVMAGSSIGAYATWGAQGASLSRKGTIGWLGGSRTSDARAASALLGYTPASIGIASWGVNDDIVSPTTTTAWAYYGEAWRMPGVNYQPTFGMELECVNFGGLPTGISNPYAVNVGGGTYGVQFGSGGGQTAGTSAASAVMTTVANPSQWQAGIVFGALAHAGVDVAGNGFAAVISMARGQGMVWQTPETRAGVKGIDTGALIRSTVAQAVNGTRLEFQDSGVVLTNAGGSAIFAAETAAAVDSYLAMQGGNGGGAAAIYARGASANIGLYPKAGGELQIGSPVTGAAGAIAATAGGGFWHININGVSLRVPLLTPAQAGS